MRRWPSLARGCPRSWRLISLDGELMRENENDGLPGRGDSLEQLLSDARWPAPAQPAVARLTQNWQQAWSARRRREALARRAAALAIAATLLGAVAIGWLGLQPKERPIAETKLRIAPSPVRSAPPPERAPIVSKSPPSFEGARHEARRPTIAAQSPTREVASEPTHWRSPNQLELLLLAAADRNPTRSTSSPSVAKERPPQNPPSSIVAKSPSNARRKASVASKGPSAEEIVRAAVKRLASDKKADPATIAAQLQSDTPRHERLLLGMLNRGEMAEQVAVLHLLAEVGSPAAVGPLLQAAAAPELHRAAILALARLSGPRLVAELALAEPNVELRQTLLAALLSPGDLASLELFLEFAADEKTADAALAAAVSVKRPPMDLLFAALSDPLEVRRVAAARVIGRIDGPATTLRLIAMVESGVNRHEACIALLSSRGAEAVHYVDSVAERDPTLASILSGARLFTTSDVPPRS
jgi:hypothetical protein